MELSGSKERCLDVPRGQSLPTKLEEASIVQVLDSTKAQSTLPLRETNFLPTHKISLDLVLIS